MIGRLRRNHIDHARCRVAAVESALRATQHFDLRNVEELLFKKMIAEKWYTVKRNGYSRICRNRNGLGADATDLDIVASKIRLGKRQVRNLLDEVGTTCSLCCG